MPHRGDFALPAQSDGFINRLLEAVLSGMLVLLLAWLLGASKQRIRARRRHLTGTWYQTSPDPRGVQQYLRFDRVRLYNLFSLVYGSVERLEPLEERPKRWRFLGRVSGPLMCGHFWATDMTSNPRSYGTFHLQMVHPFLWVGRYTTSVGSLDGATAVTQELKDFPLEWSRDRPIDSS
jgi:hypothetical protein